MNADELDEVGFATVMSAPLSGSAETPTAGGGILAVTGSWILGALRCLVSLRRWQL